MSAATACYGLWLMARARVRRTGGTARVGRKTLQFTLPSDATVLELRWYAPGKRGTFQWWRPILTRTEDYQRMLNGIWGQPMDYFDGDTMPLQ